MRKGTTVLLVVAGAALAGLLGYSRCSTPKDKGAQTSAKRGDSRAGSDAPGKATAAAGASSSAVARSRREDGGAGDEKQGGVVFFSPWGGSNTNQLGRERPSEGNPMAPMSLARDGKGRLYVLDQVNGRVVRHGADGKVDQVTEIKLTAPQDVAVGKDGSMAVLDRLGTKAIGLYDESGALKTQLPLGGDGVEDPGLITGVFVDGSDVYVEKEHGPLVRVGDTEGGLANPRTQIPGRPSRDGLSFLNAGITDAKAGRAYVSSIDRATNEHRFTRELKLGAPIRTILLLDSDLSGTIYFATELERPGGDVVFLQCLDPLKGVPVGSAVLPVNTLPEETFRDLTVLDDGGVVYAVRSDDGVSYQHYDCN